MYGLEVLGMTLVESVIKTVVHGRSEFVIFATQAFRRSMTIRLYTNYWKVPLAVRIPQLYLNRRTGEKSTGIRSSTKYKASTMFHTDTPPNSARRLQISRKDLPVCRVTLRRLTEEEILRHQVRRLKLNSGQGDNLANEKKVVDVVTGDKNTPTRCASVIPPKVWRKGKQGKNTHARLHQVSSNKRKACSRRGRYSKIMRIPRSTRKTSDRKRPPKRKRKTSIPLVESRLFSNADELLANPYLHRLIDNMIPGVIENSFVPEVSDLERITQDDPLDDEDYTPTFDQDPAPISVRVPKPKPCALTSFYFHKYMYFNDILVIHAEVEDFSFSP